MYIKNFNVIRVGSHLSELIELEYWKFLNTKFI